MLIWVINHDIHFRLIKCKIGFLYLINWALKLDLGLLCCKWAYWALLYKVGFRQIGLDPIEPKTASIKPKCDLMDL